MINKQLELLSFIENSTVVSSEEVYQTYRDSDQYKVHENKREAYYTPRLEEYKLKNWIYGDISIKYLLHVTMANTKWVKLLCGLTIEMPTLSDVVNNYNTNKDNPQDCITDFNTLKGMIETYTTIGITAPEPFVVVENFEFIDGNHRVIALALTKKPEFKVKSYVALP
jgi:hypothetical protein